MIRPVDDLCDDAFGHHLAGLIDGEGCFMIIDIPRQLSYCTRLTIKLRADDSALLDAIQRRTTLGSVYHYPNSYSSSRPMVSWLVNSHQDCVGIVRLLERYPLISKKARDYEIWKNAVAAIARKRRNPGGRVALRQDWSDLAALKSELEAVRAYVTPVAAYTKS